MKFEFDQICWHVTYEGDEDDVQDFKCNSGRQFEGLIKHLLTPAQWNRFSEDRGIVFEVSKKRYLAGVEYMKNNPYNTRQ